MKIKCTSIRSLNKIEYRLLINKQIGSGSYGKVFVGYKNDQPDQYLAIKQMDYDQKNLKEIKKTVLREFEILTKFNNPNIIKLFDVAVTHKHIYLVYEYCDGQDLDKFCNRTKLSEHQTLLFMRHICAGFKDLFDAEVLHRDLKPTNIFLHEGMAKIGDFGSSRFFSAEENSIMMSQMVGTLSYISPEILKGERDIKKCDVWSFGVLVFELLNGRTPWKANKEVALIEEINKIKYKPIKFDEEPRRSEKMKDLIRKMLVMDPEERIGWPEIFKLVFGFDEIERPLQNSMLKAKNNRRAITDLKDNFLAEKFKTEIAKKPKTKPVIKLDTITKEKGKKPIIEQEELKNNNNNQGKPTSNAFSKEGNFQVESTIFLNNADNMEEKIKFLEKKKLIEKKKQECLQQAKDFIYFNLNISYFFGNCATLMNFTQNKFALLAEFLFHQILYIFTRYQVEYMKKADTIFQDFQNLQIMKTNDEERLREEIDYNFNESLEKLEEIKAFFKEKENSDKKNGNLDFVFLKKIESKLTTIEEFQELLNLCLREFLKKIEGDFLDNRINLKNNEDRDCLKLIRFCLVFFDLENIEQFWRLKNETEGGFLMFYEKYDNLEIELFIKEIKAIIKRRIGNNN